jgi:hypothetical protein
MAARRKSPYPCLAPRLRLEVSDFQSADREHQSPDEFTYLAGWEIGVCTGATMRIAIEGSSA